jgi:hypothetical protein
LKDKQSLSADNQATSLVGLHHPINSPAPTGSSGIKQFVTFVNSTCCCYHKNQGQHYQHYLYTTFLGAAAYTARRVNNGNNDNNDNNASHLLAVQDMLSIGANHDQ